MTDNINEVTDDEEFREFTDDENSYRQFILELLDSESICVTVAHRKDYLPCPGNIMDVILKYQLKDPVCPMCHKGGGCHVLVKDGDKKDTTQHRIYRDGTEIRLTLSRKAYKCDCGHAFRAPIPKRLRKDQLAREAVLLAIAPATYQYPANVAFSKAEWSAVLNDVLKKTWDVVDGIREAQDEYEKQAAKVINSIVSYRCCRILYFIPFEFRKESRCLVCGLSGDTAYMLDILESSSVKAIKDCITRRIRYKDHVNMIYCGVDDKIVKVLKEQFQRAEVIYSRKCIQDYIRGYYRELPDPTLGTKSKGYRKIMNIVKTETVHKYLDAFRAWWDELTEVIQERSSEIHHLFCKSDNKMMERTFQKPYERSSFSCLLELIKGQGNCSFIVMKTKLLLNREMAKYGTPIMYLTHMSQMPTFDDFGVNLEELFLEQERYNKILRAAGIRVKELDWWEELRGITEICEE